MEWGTGYEDKILCLFFILFIDSWFFSFRKTITADHRSISLDVLDTAGEEEYSALRDQYMRSGDVFLIVYDVTRRNTFGDIGWFIEQIARVRDLDDTQSVIMVLCGNKIDLSSERQVSKEECMSAAEDCFSPFIETSAKTGENVEEAFRLAACRYFSSSSHNENDNTDGSERKTKCIICWAPQLNIILVVVCWM